MDEQGTRRILHQLVNLTIVRQPSAGRQREVDMCRGAGRELVIATQINDGPNFIFTNSVLKSRFAQLSRPMNGAFFNYVEAGY